jgi:hypothetical protein
MGQVANLLHILTEWDTMLSDNGRQIPELGLTEQTNPVNLFDWLSFQSDVPFVPASDALGRTAALKYYCSVPLLGVPLEVHSNSSEVVAATERSFGRWRCLAPEHVSPLPPREIHVVVHPGQSKAAFRLPLVYRLHGNTFVAAAGDNLFTVQLDRGAALAFVTPEMVADDLYFRHAALECMALLLAARTDRTPVHAGAVVRNGRAVLLAGHSLSGKSTLCYACVRTGFDLLAEDVVYVSRAGGLRIWGNPWRIHLMPDALRFFPELTHTAQLQVNGKLKLAVDVATASDEKWCLFAEQAAVCLLQRHDGPQSELEVIDAPTVIEALSQNLETGFDVSGDPLAAAFALAQGESYRLWLGRDLGQAVALLEGLTDHQRPPWSR